ncbi:hypothetical protein LSUE1_G005138 [Lachnellula suecica]|uniref:Gfd2/YDR514C-like C-terminal domain-containing protein n=1 Tax=Lachnellula suecica TaxID=602035 RepID=A0A8T9C4K5_9HELO|nr:hypothetical protein LSUE1_G005138 [Lachnellula suecica]
MSPDHEKNTQAARRLTPSRTINLHGLRNLQQNLGLPLNPCFLLEKQAQNNYHLKSNTLSPEPALSNISDTTTPDELALWAIYSPQILKRDVSSTAKSTIQVSTYEFIRSLVEICTQVLSRLLGYVILSCLVLLQQGNIAYYYICVSLFGAYADKDGKPVLSAQQDPPGELRLLESGLPDVLFISLDFEFVDHSTSKKGIWELNEIGISTLDTRIFDCHSSSTNIIRTQHYRTNLNQRDFLFGTSIDTVQRELLLILRRLFYMQVTPHDEIRNIILVGHNIRSEIHLMKLLGIDLNDAPSIADILDTQLMGREIFGNGVRLRNLLETLGIKSRYLHNAANDAHFTLQAMLLLAIYRYDPSEFNEPYKSRFRLYQELAKN